MKVKAASMIMKRAAEWGSHLLLGMLLAGVAVAQEPTSTPATQPTTTQATTRPVRPENPLRSPWHTVTFFLDQAEQASADEGDFSVAMGALDFGELTDDPEQLEHVGPDYARKLYEILRRLEAEGYLDPDNEEMLPRDPAAASPHSIARPPLVFILARRERTIEGLEHPLHEWRFVWSSVQTVPQRYENLDELIAQIANDGATDEVLAERQTPRALVTSFLDSAGKYRTTNDVEAFQAALDMLDFSSVLREHELGDAGAEAIEKFKDDEGAAYILGIERVLDTLLEMKALDIERLPDEPDAEHKPMWALGGDVKIGKTELSLLLVRRGDVVRGQGQWFFGPDGVQRVPEMVAALDAAEEVLEESAPAGPLVVQQETQSPRATLGTFLTAMEAGRVAEAAECLDLSELSGTQRDLATNLAGKLWLVLARREPILLQTVPDAPAGDERYTLFAQRVGQIAIGPVFDDAGRVEWLFTADTVSDIEPLYEEFQRRPIHEGWRDTRLSFYALPELYIREYVIPQSLKGDLLGLKIWQWVGIPLVLVLGWFAYLLTWIVLPLVARLCLRQPGQMYLPGTFRAELRPTAVVVMILAWWGGFRLLDLGALLSSPIYWLLRIVFTAVVVVATYRLITIIMGYFRDRAARTHTRVDDVLMPLLEKTLKFVTVALGIMFAISVIFDVEVGPLFAGLGVGGLAVAFAAKDTIANFFGSVNVVLDRPFEVGDWVKINNTEGIVEDVGIRSSKIRTFWKSQIIVPNSEIMSATIENFQRRNYRRTYAIISVTYDTTPEQLEAFCEGIREIVRQHPHTWKDYYHVYVKEFAASSIDIMLYCFHDVPDWGLELSERHKLLLDIIRLATRLNVGFAFPTQTIHLYQEQHGDRATPVPNEPDAALRLGREEAVRLVRELGHTGGSGQS